MTALGTGSTGRAAGVRAVALALLLALAAAAPAAAQGLVGGQSGDGPLKIDAEDGIEWRRDEQVYIARGNASASRGDVTVYADRLVAHYRDTQGGGGQQDGGSGGSGVSGTGGTEIYRIEAIGSVRIVDDRAVAQGDKGVYDLDQQVVVLTGEDLQFETDQETITATDSLEYWQGRDLAVARGDATAVRGDRRIQAAVLAARFAPQDGEGTAQQASAGSAADGDRPQQITRIEAFDNVRISTPQEYARGDRGVYNTRTEIATLTGNVRLTRGENQLNGGWGQVNLKTGVSRLLGAPPDSGEKRRVNALLAPDSARNADVSDTGEAEAAANAAADGDARGGTGGDGGANEGNR